MVAAYTSESEQIEHVKKIAREYGGPVLLGVVLALVIGFGWRAWQAREERILEHASMRYEQLITNVVNGNTDAVQIQAMRLMKRYPRTPYAQLAALQLARQDVYENKFSDAETQLRWVMKHGNNPALRQVARIRVARVLIAENQAQQALDLLNKVDDKAFDSAIWETKGDAYKALNNTDQAKIAYQNALNSFHDISLLQPTIQMKIDDMATNTGTTQ